MEAYNKRVRSDEQSAIMFSDADYTCKGIDDLLPMVINAEIKNCLVLRVSINIGSAADILYWSAFLKMGLSESLLQPFDGALAGTIGKPVPVKGYVDLDTTFGEGEHARIIKVRYLVIDSWTVYNVIIGRPTLHKLGAVVSTLHLAMKYQVGNGKVGVVKADLEMARKCYEMCPNAI